jgi:hypothetical protein
VTGSSTERAKTVLHPVFDLTAAKPVYAALLGVAPQHDSDYCVGFDVAGQDIGMVPGGAVARAAWWPCQRPGWQRTRAALGPLGHRRKR